MDIIYIHYIYIYEYKQRVVSVVRDKTEQVRRVVTFWNCISGVLVLLSVRLLIVMNEGFLYFTQFLQTNCEPTFKCVIHVDAASEFLPSRYSLPSLI
jgi:hypothetical protein